VFRTPYIKTYRLPTPLLIFQLALIPGSLLTGILLSPLLYLSRHLAQRPVHRLRFPHEKPTHRRLLAIGFYAGAAIVVVGVVGVWARWCLGWRDPWIWTIFFLLDGIHVWTRPALIAYWGALALFGVAAWQRQLSRARRHRRYIPPGAVRDSTSSTSSAGSIPPAHVYPSGASAVATQMMDAADQRMPTLSVNARRKSFHALAVAMFIPGMAVDPAFTHLSYSVAFAAFTFAEYVRYFALWPLGASVHLFLNEFIDHKDSGTAILSHFYLLAGCATPLWLEGPSPILAFFGVLALGIGDAVASIVGRKIGYARWSPASGKTVEGSAAFLASVVASAVLMYFVGAVDEFAFVQFVTTTVLVTLMEAFSAQNDNLVLPVYGWAVGTLLGV
jgi:dolichol kinase